MCKRHWKAVHFPETPTKEESQPPPPEGESVYDGVLPQSISYRPGLGGKPDHISPDGVAPDGVCLMPLVAFLRNGADREAGWHRQAERRARGMFTVGSLSSQLEPWERQVRT